MPIFIFTARPAGTASRRFDDRPFFRFSENLLFSLKDNSQLFEQYLDRGEMKESGKIFSAEHRQSADSVRTKIEVLEDLHRHLSVALEDVGALKFSESTVVPDVKPGLNFYREVKRFEIALIQRALRQSGGRQAEAASLLGLKASTLYSKIKAYKIDCKRGLHEA